MKDYLNKAIGNNGSVPLEPPDDIKKIIEKAEEGREAMMNAQTDEEREAAGEKVLQMLLDSVKEVMHNTPPPVRSMLIMVAETQRKLSMLDCKRAGREDIVLRKLIDL